MSESPKRRTKKALKGGGSLRALTKEITEAHLATVEAAGAFGLPRTKVADLLGISYDTYQRRCMDFPQLEEVYRRGRANALLRVTKVAFDAAASGADMTTTRWWINRRLGPGLAPKGTQEEDPREQQASMDARQVQEMELVRKIVGMTDEQLEARAAEIEMQLNSKGVYQKKPNESE